MRRTAAVLSLTLVALTLAACQPARAGARCRTTDFGEDGTYVLQCRSGRWVRTMTKAAAANLILAVIASKTTTTTTLPDDPLTQRLIATVQGVFGPSYWAGQILGVPWSVAPAIPGGSGGMTNCSYATRGGQTVSVTPTVSIQADVVQNASDKALADLVAHEGAHVIACLRWAAIGSAPPNWPSALNGAAPAESFADCFGRYMRGPTYFQYYGCPNDQLPAQATQLAVP